MDDWESIPSRIDKRIKGHITGLKQSKEYIWNKAKDNILIELLFKNISLHEVSYILACPIKEIKKRHKILKRGKK